jgi:hypothetical protein
LSTNETALGCKATAGGAVAPVRQHFAQSVQEACECGIDFAVALSDPSMDTCAG